MEYSLNGLHLTENFEGCCLSAYQDTAGVWTIGYGHTGPHVSPGLTITQAEAEELLIEDIRRAADAVNAAVDVPLTQDEFDALVDFAFNVGVGAFYRSTMLHLLNQKNYQGAAAQFDLWDKSGGHMVAGLLRRRQAETAIFDAPEQENQA